MMNRDKIAEEFGSAAKAWAIRHLANSNPRFANNNSQLVDYGVSLREYIYYHRVMTLFAQTLIAEQSISEYPDNVEAIGHSKRKVDPTEYTHRLKPTRDSIESDGITSMYETTAHIPGYRGKLHPIHLLHINYEDPEKDCWVARADIAHDTSGGALISYREPVIIRKNNRGHFAVTSRGVTVNDSIQFGDHQLFGLIAAQNALMAGKYDQALVFATGTGKSFVLLAPAIATGRGGVFCVPNQAQCDQFIKDIHVLDRDVNPDQIKTSADIPSGCEADALLRHYEGEYKYLVITHEDDDMKRFISADLAEAIKQSPDYANLTLNDLKERIASIRFFIDEVHEVDLEILLLLLERKNNVLAVTATWTDELQELFGDPMAELNMDYALNKLRAFRDIITNLVQFKARQTLEDQAFEIVADYFGIISFVDKDNTPESEEKFITYAKVADNPELLALGHEQLIDLIMQSTEQRRYDHLNMAFSKNRNMITALHAAYQGVFDGDYSRLERLAERVSATRAEARIRQLWTVENQMFGVTHPAHAVPKKINLADPKIARRFEKIIEKSRVTTEDLKAEAHNTLRTKIADVMTRRIAGLFLNDTPPNLIRADQVNGKLHKKLHDLSFPTGELDPEQKLLLANLSEGETNDIFRRISATLEPLSAEERGRILYKLKAGDVTALIIQPSQINLASFPEASYAQFIEPGDNAGAAKTAQDINEGYILHTVTDNELATGFSNADIKSVQRHIEKNIMLAVIRATQILGRAIRGKDGVAWASDYVSANFDISGKLGEAQGRPFTFGDVLRPNYGDAVKTFIMNFSKS